jgi:hypothetical protein
MRPSTSTFILNRLSTWSDYLRFGWYVEYVLGLTDTFTISSYTIYMVGIDRYLVIVMELRPLIDISLCCRNTKRKAVEKFDGVYTISEHKSRQYNGPHPESS